MKKAITLKALFTIAFVTIALVNVTLGQCTSASAVYVLQQAPARVRLAALPTLQVQLPCMRLTIHVLPY